MNGKTTSEQPIVIVTRINEMLGSKSDRFKDLVDHATMLYVVQPEGEKVAYDFGKGYELVTMGEGEAIEEKVLDALKENQTGKGQLIEVIGSFIQPNEKIRLHLDQNGYNVTTSVGATDLHKRPYQ